ncbi:ABC transporter substrate-binding protein [Kitasatospora sp. NPDC050543]|uniref:ABC transporter substrate-binding protein n=1 Tax=Kitasatospora sp. NPDC050543 TaxID=3364054 RepID=UPI0037B31C1D
MTQQISRRALLAGLGAAALTGCHGILGGAPDTALATGPDGSPSPTPPPPVTVNTARGPVTVPGAPLRVVTLDTAELDSAMTLGITPVGAARAPVDQDLPDYWPVSRLARIRDVGTIGNPDYTAIRALRPDLILSNQTTDGTHYDVLRELAPTVLTQTTGSAWKDNFQLHAQALSRQRAAAAFVGSYQRHVSQVVQGLSAAGRAGRRISLVRFVEGAGIRLYGRQSFPGTLLSDVQLGRPDAQNVDQFAVEIPADQIARADGDHLFYATYGDPGRAGATAVLASPGWQALGAVRAHRAFPVDDQLWFQGIGYTGANAVLDELLRLLGG